MPINICFGFIEKYVAEQKTLSTDIGEIENKIRETKTTQQGADNFIRDIKKYLDVPELTRKMCYELLDRVVVSGLPKITCKERQIDIVYKVNIMSVLKHKLPK